MSHNNHRTLKKQGKLVENGESSLALTQSTFISIGQSKKFQESTSSFEKIAKSKQSALNFSDLIKFQNVQNQCQSSNPKANNSVLKYDYGKAFSRDQSSIFALNVTDQNFRTLTKLDNSDSSEKSEQLIQPTISDDVNFTKICSSKISLQGRDRRLNKSTQFRKTQIEWDPEKLDNGNLPSYLPTIKSPQFIKKSSQKIKFPAPDFDLKIPRNMKFTNKSQNIDIENLRTQLRQSHLQKGEYHPQVQSSDFQKIKKKIYKPNSIVYSSVDAGKIKYDPQNLPKMIDSSLLDQDMYDFILKKPQKSSKKVNLSKTIQDKSSFKQEKGSYKIYDEFIDNLKMIEIQDSKVNLNDSFNIELMANQGGPKYKTNSIVEQEKTMKILKDYIENKNGNTKDTQLEFLSKSKKQDKPRVSIKKRKDDEISLKPLGALAKLRRKLDKDPRYQRRVTKTNEQIQEEFLQKIDEVVIQGKICKLSPMEVEHRKFKYFEQKIKPNEKARKSSNYDMTSRSSFSQTHTAFSHMYNFMTPQPSMRNLNQIDEEKHEKSEITSVIFESEGETENEIEKLKMAKKVLKRRLTRISPGKSPKIRKQKNPVQTDVKLQNPAKSAKLKIQNSSPSQKKQPKNQKKNGNHIKIQIDSEPESKRSDGSSHSLSSSTSNSGLISPSKGENFFKEKSQMAMQLLASPLEISTQKNNKDSAMITSKNDNSDKSNYLLLSPKTTQTHSSGWKQLKRRLSFTKKTFDTGVEHILRQQTEKQMLQLQEMKNHSGDVKNARKIKNGLKAVIENLNTNKILKSESWKQVLAKTGQAQEQIIQKNIELQLGIEQLQNKYQYIQFVQNELINNKPLFIEEFPQITDIMSTNRDINKIDQEHFLNQVDVQIFNDNNSQLLEHICRSTRSRQAIGTKDKDIPFR